MKLDIISYVDLMDAKNILEHQKLETALLTKGIVGIKNIPDYEKTARDYINAARKFEALSEAIKQQYAPDRDSGDTEGYESGAEHFKNAKGEWQPDDKKVSFYAFLPEMAANKWPREVDLRQPYMQLAKLIFQTGKKVLNVLALNDAHGIEHDKLMGHCRLLHYKKENDLTNANPDWCGGHFDHGLFTGLIPAYYFQDGVEVDEPAEAGLYIKPNNGNDYEKINANDKSILLFQVGEFGQLYSNDRIRATKHIVKKTSGGIDRYTFALFYDVAPHTTVKSHSELIHDPRYINNQLSDGTLVYSEWSKASFEQYRVK